MIAYIQGKLIEKLPTHVVIDVHGVGYHINISLNTFSQIGDDESLKLHTHFHVKEDSQTLFGFMQPSEKLLFGHLISISGVGPSTAIMMLSSLTPKEIKKAIITEDVKTIQSVKGIGAKGAQRVIIELKDKLKKELDASDSEEIVLIADNSIRDEAFTALVTLGIPKNAAEKSIDRILRKEKDITLEELIKWALKTA